MGARQRRRRTRKPCFMGGVSVNREEQALCRRRNAPPPSFMGGIHPELHAMQNCTSHTAAHVAPAISPAKNETRLQALLQRLGFRKTPAKDAPANTAEPINVFDYEAMSVARKNARAWADYVLERAGDDETPPAHEAPKLGDIPDEVLRGIIADALVSQRFFISFNGILTEKPISIVTVPENACIVDFENDNASMIAEMVPRARIMEIIAALARRAM